MIWYRKKLDTWIFVKIVTKNSNITFLTESQSTILTCREHRHRLYSKSFEDTEKKVSLAHIKKIK